MGKLCGTKKNKNTSSNHNATAMWNKTLTKQWYDSAMMKGQSTDKGKSDGHSQHTLRKRRALAHPLCQPVVANTRVTATTAATWVMNPCVCVKHGPRLRRNDRPVPNSMGSLVWHGRLRPLRVGRPPTAPLHMRPFGEIRDATKGGERIGEWHARAKGDARKSNGETGRKQNGMNNASPCMRCVCVLHDTHTYVHAYVCM